MTLTVLAVTLTLLPLSLISLINLQLLRAQLGTVNYTANYQLETTASKAYLLFGHPFIGVLVNCIYSNNNNNNRKRDIDA